MAGAPASKAPLTAIDTETDSARRNAQAQIVGISFSVRRRACLHPLRHEGLMRPRSCRWTKCWPASSPGWKTRTPQAGPAHQVRPPCVFANHGIEVQGYAHDTMLQSYVLEVHRPQPDQPGRAPHGPQGISYEDLCGKGAPDPVCAGAVDKGRRLRVRRRRPDPGRAQRPVATAAGATPNCASSTNWRLPAARCCTASNATAC